MNGAVQLYCVVCGAGSTRPFVDWVNKADTSIGPLVACDSHSVQEFQAGLVRLKASVVQAPVVQQPVKK